MQKVVTHGYTDNSLIDACKKHEHRVPNFSRRGASYSGVSRGLHRGTCDVCDLERRAAGAVANATRAAMVMTSPDGRRVVTDERMRVQSAMQRETVTDAMVAELERVVSMWEVMAS